MALGSGRNTRATGIRVMWWGDDRPTDRTYDRARDLPRLLPMLAQSLIEPDAPIAQSRLIALLRRALRAERVRAREGHWSYDPARHAALLRAFQLEVRASRARSVDTIRRG